MSSDSLLTELGIQDLDVVLRVGGVGWFGHVERSTGWISEVRRLSVVAQKGSGMPRKSWDGVIGSGRGGLDMGSAGPRGHSGWGGRLPLFGEDLSKSPTLGRGKRALKWI